jgi:EAL domain-containing protein (putative c-di-GMP-specific phosphodiesterase class I)
MCDRNGGLISPQEFIPAAERYNIATKVDRWVVRNAFRFLAKQQVQSAQAALTAINLSGLSFSDEDFLDYIVQLFEETRLAPQNICFEITETGAITYLAAANHFIHTLKELGCRFALDDFGSGMSSFTYLKVLPIDFLKIDGMFVRNINHDPSQRAMVEAINRVGQVMNLKTIAEHVEDEAVWQTLREMGVDYVQGYGVEMPHPLE